MNTRAPTDWSFTRWMALLALFAWVGFSSLATLKEAPGLCAAYGEKHSIDDANPLVDLICIPFRYPF